MRPPFSEDRERSIDRSDIGWNTLIESLQRDFLSEALRLVTTLSQDEDGRIRITEQNYTKAAALGQVWDQRLQQQLMGPLFEYFIDAGLDLLGLNSEYFKEMVTLGVQEFLGIQVGAEQSIWDIYGYNPDTGLVSNGPLSTVFGSTAPSDDLISVLTQGISAALPVEEMVDSVSRETTGVDGEGNGGLKKHLEATLPDPFVTFDRVTGEVYSVPLKLEHVIYQGGLINTSRPFCIIRNNRPFTREEIEKFGTPEDEHGGYTNKEEGDFAGKWPKEGYNPFRHLGGYNCRHALDWISEGLYNFFKKQEQRGIQQSGTPTGDPVQPFSIIDKEATEELARFKTKTAKFWGEPLTEKLKGIVKAAPGSKMVGLDFRYKSQGSTERKIQSESVNEGWNEFEVTKKDLMDMVRFTALIDPDNYTQSMKQIVMELEKEGWSLLKLKNTWGTDFYRGVNANFINADDEVFELQFHTPDSFHAKEGIRDGVKTEGFITSHDYYELSREIGISKAEKGHWDQQGVALWQSVPVPTDILNIQTVIFDRDATRKLTGEIQGFDQNLFSIIEKKNFWDDREDLIPRLEAESTRQARVKILRTESERLGDLSSNANMALSDGQWDDLSEAATAKLQKAVDKIDAEWFPILDELEALEADKLDIEKWRSDLLQGRSKGTFTAISDGNQHMDIAVGKVDDFLQALIGPNVGDGLDQQYESSINRGQYNPITKLVSVAPREYGTAVHEMGHALEDFNPGLSRAVQSYLAKRRDDFDKEQKTPTSLNTLKNSVEYGADEVAWKTTFSNPYMAKYYDDGGTEVLTMMIESWYEDPVAFYQDRETWNFIWTLINQ